MTFMCIIIMTCTLLHFVLLGYIHDVNTADKINTGWLVIRHMHVYSQTLACTRLQYEHLHNNVNVLGTQNDMFVLLQFWVVYTLY